LVWAYITIRNMTASHLLPENFFISTYFVDNYTQ
jgi:hypothetical protein